MIIIISIIIIISFIIIIIINTIIINTIIITQIRDGFSSNSFRLMAMAVGVIPDVHELDLLRMTQQQVEAHVTHMELLCLMVLTNNIRLDSKSTMTELQDG